MSDDLDEEDLFGDADDLDDLAADDLDDLAADDLDDLDGWDDAGGLDEGDDYSDDLIIGRDDRVRVHAAPRAPSTRLFPFNTICYIETQAAAGRRPWGTGTLLTPRVVLTAGHVLRRATRPLRVTPGATFDLPAARAAARSAGSPAHQGVRATHFRTRRDYAACTPTDYGIIILPRPFVRPTRFMPLQARAASRSAIRVTIAGFPGDKNRVQPGTMWRHSEAIETVATADGMLRHRIDTMPGNSGSPIWLLGQGGTRIQIGVHVGGPSCDRRRTRNVGVRITNAVIAQIASWCRAARVRAPVMWRQRP